MVMLPVAIWAKLVTALSAGYLKGQSYQWLKWPVMKVIVTWEVSPHSLTGIWLNLLWLRHSFKWRPVLQDIRLCSSLSSGTLIVVAHILREWLFNQKNLEEQELFFSSKFRCIIRETKNEKNWTIHGAPKKLARFENAGKPDSSQTNFKATLSL